MAFCTTGNMLSGRGDNPQIGNLSLCPARLRGQRNEAELAAASQIVTVKLSASVMNGNRPCT